MAKYRTIEVKVEAVKFDPKVFEKKSWKPGEVKYYACVSRDESRGLYMIQTAERLVTISPGDYIVKMSQGYGPWDRVFFEKWFEPDKGGKR